MSESKIPVIRKDAQIQMTFGVSFIQRLQNVAVYLTAERSEEELDSFSAELSEKKTEYEESWKNQYMTIMTLLTAIDKAAVDQGFVDNMTEEEFSQQDS